MIESIQTRFTLFQPSRLHFNQGIPNIKLIEDIIHRNIYIYMGKYTLNDGILFAEQYNPTSIVNLRLPTS